MEKSDYGDVPQHVSEDVQSSDREGALEHDSGSSDREDLSEEDLTESYRETWVFSTRWMRSWENKLLKHWEE